MFHTCWGAPAVVFTECEDVPGKGVSWRQKLKTARAVYDVLCQCTEDPRIGSTAILPCHGPGTEVPELVPTPDLPAQEPVDCGG